MFGRRKGSLHSEQQAIEQPTASKVLQKLSDKLLLWRQGLSLWIKETWRELSDIGLPGVKEGDGSTAIKPPPIINPDWPHQEISFETRYRSFEIGMIALRNALLTLMTATLYRFWARTRVRRYLWSRIFILGEPLDYTGTSLELFLGFLKIILILVIPLVGVSIWMELLVAPDSPLIIPYAISIYIGLAFLYGVAKYRTQRYRLSRTLWRGIRMGLKGSWISYGVRTLFLVYLNVATLLWAYPLQRIVLLRQLVGHMTLGNREFHFDGEPGPLYPSFAIAWVLSVAGFVGAYLLANDVLNMLLGSRAIAVDSLIADGVLNLSTDQFVSLLLTSVLVYVFAGLVLAVTTAWYRAKELRYFAECMSLDGLRFTLKADGFSVMRLNIGNAFIVLLTLGLGLPIAQMRTFRFWFERLSASGKIDIESIRQGDAPYLWVGEGLAEFFDIGAV